MTREELTAKFTELRNSISSIDDLATLVLDNQDLFWASAKMDPYWGTSGWSSVGKKHHKGVVMPMPVLGSIEIYHLTWKEQLANTHSSPINGVQNFRQSDDKATHYPGWRGRVKWSVQWPEEFDGYYVGSTLFDSLLSGLSTGSGGGGRWRDGFQTFSYDCNIFAADWPKIYDKKIRHEYIIRENKRREQVWRAVGGKTSPKLITAVPDEWNIPDPLNFKW
jgi:hypothetical protein